MIAAFTNQVSGEPGPAQGIARPPIAQIVAFIEANQDNVVDGRPAARSRAHLSDAAGGSEHLLRRPRPRAVRTQRDVDLISRLVELWRADYDKRTRALRRLIARCRRVVTCRTQVKRGTGGVASRSWDAYVGAR